MTITLNHVTVKDTTLSKMSPVLAFMESSKEYHHMSSEFWEPTMGTFNPRVGNRVVGQGRLPGGTKVV